MDKLVVCLALMLVTVYWADLNLVLSDVIGELSGEAVRNWTPESGVNPEELGHYFEGDLNLPAREYGSRAFVISPQRQWRNRTIPFTITNDFTREEQGQITEVIYRLGVEACVFFGIQNDLNVVDYVYIDNKPTGCWSSSIGRKGGKQIVNLQTPNCMYNRTIVHEMLHVLGAIHEHTRWDRDRYITVLRENINDSMRHNFWKKAKREVEDPFDYDYKSVMHYSKFAFSKNKLPTIIPKKPGVVIGKGQWMSEQDCLEVKSFYLKPDLDCPDTTFPMPIYW